MNKRALTILLVSVGTIAVGVTVSKITGYWRTENSKIPAKISDGEFAGTYNPGDIRGSYSFDDIEIAFGIPADTMAEAFGFESSAPGEIKAKDLETVWDGLPGDLEIGTDSIRLFTSLWRGLPYVPEITTILPASAVKLLEEKKKIGADKAEELYARTPESPEYDENPGNEESSTDTAATETSSPETHEVPERMVRGLTTFGDLKGWGVSEDAWIEAAGVAMGSRATSLKDWSTAESRSVSELKTIAQDLVDAAE